MKQVLFQSPRFLICRNRCCDLVEGGHHPPVLGLRDKAANEFNGLALRILYGQAGGVREEIVDCVVI